MGMLIDGKWQADDGGFASDEGDFKRKDSRFRNWVTRDGAPGPTGEGGFKAETGRYHLYVARACPWAHRATLLREFKGLQDIVGLSVTHWLMAEDGWTFASGPGVVPDSVNGVRAMHELYALAKPDYTGKATVPVLWDKQRGTIVNNESADILRMFNDAFAEVGASGPDLSPAALRDRIDAVNERVYDGLNNGVYKAGFATTQSAYDDAVAGVFETLDWLESELSAREWLVGDAQTEADWRTWTTLLRFDAVYHGHFKCNLRRLADYPALSAYARRMRDMPGVEPTVDMDHIKRHYYQSHRSINPTGIVPAGPAEGLG